MRARILAAWLFVLLCAMNVRANGIATRISPDHVIAGSPNITLTIYGQNFNGFENLIFNGHSYSVSFVSSSTVTATVLSTQLNAIGSYSVYINSNPSVIFRFRVLSPLASLKEYSPTQFPTAVNTPVTVYGQEFPSNATILFDFQPITTTFVSSTLLTGTVPGSLIASSPNTTHHILVYNGPFTAASIGTLQSADIISSDQPQISLSNVIIGTSLTGTAMVRSLQGTVTLSTPFQTITGPNSGDFSITGGACANGKVLPVGTSCAANVTATPSAFPSSPAIWVANHSYMLNDVIVDNANSDPNGAPHLQKATTAGTSGTDSPGSQIAGTTNWNESGGTTAEGPDTLVWTDQGPYTISVSESATLTINSNAANNPQYILLSLTKTLPAVGAPTLTIGSVQLNTSGYDFGTVVQSVPPVRTVTLQNTGGGFMLLSTPFYTITATNAGDFSLSGGTCAAAQFLNVGDSCTFNWTFTPSTTAAEGPATFTLNWTSIGGSVGSATQSLTGTGKTAGTKIALAWSASGSGSLTGYNVYRGTQSGGPYTLLTSLGIVTSYNDMTPVHGNTYCYVVTAVSTSPPYTTPASGNSNEACATF